MRLFFIFMLASIPLVLIFSLGLWIYEKQYNAGTRAVDQLITKTRLLAVNGVETVTHKGALSGAIVGHMLAGDIGAVVGAMSAEQVHRDNEFTFLVYYSESKQGKKKEIEKVRQSSGRFHFLVSKLEDEAREKPKKQRAEKPAAAIPERSPSGDAAKKVLVPIGDYIVGEDIPAGSYTLTSTKYAALHLHENADAESYADSYECEEPNFTIGKITLKDGMMVQIRYSDMTFEPFRGLGF